MQDEAIKRRLAQAATGNEITLRQVRLQPVGCALPWPATANAGTAVSYIITLFPPCNSSFCFLKLQSLFCRTILPLVTHTRLLNRRSLRVSLFAASSPIPRYSNSLPGSTPIKMQYSLVAVAAFAAVASALPGMYISAPSSNSTLTTLTVYATTEITVTSCAATVVSCPAHSTVIVTSTIVDYTTVRALPPRKHEYR